MIGTGQLSFWLEVPIWNKKRINMNKNVEFTHININNYTVGTCSYDKTKTMVHLTWWLMECFHIRLDYLIICYVQ